jgi:hypothetical protein
MILETIRACLIHALEDHRARRVRVVDPSPYGMCCFKR